MIHTAEETLTETKKVYDGLEGRFLADTVSPTHPGKDVEWWVVGVDHNTFAVGTWDGGSISFRDYKP